MHYIEYKRKLLNLIIIRRILTGKTWPTVGRWHAYAQLLKRNLGKGLGTLLATGCEGPYYLSRVHHIRKIRDRKQRTDIGMYSFVVRTIKNWNQLLAEG